jgi:hypothetical protein
MLLVLGSLSYKHFPFYDKPLVSRSCSLPNRFVDVFAGGVTWDALDDIVVLGVLSRPISMLILLKGLSIFLTALDF